MKPLLKSIDYRKELNPQQYKVVTEAEGPCLVLAGAGSGKTRVLVYRLAYLVEKGISPYNIVLVTFTNKAARQMISRAEVLLKMSLSRMWMGTFHHLGNIILRREAHLLGYTPEFTIIDRQDSEDLLQDCLEELGFNRRKKLFPKKELIMNINSKSINSRRSLQKVVLEDYPHMEEYLSEIKRVIVRYQKKKREANIVDFDDLLFLWLKLLEEKEPRERYSRLFNYILVDEYQDTNRLQFEILKRISGFHRNILVVGDDAQSIYSFRSAEIRNILDFPDCFKDSKIFKLEINYRSTPQILNLANKIIQNNSRQFEKSLQAIKRDGPLPVLVGVKDVYRQAEFVADKIVEFSQKGILIGDIAVLFRSRYLSLELELELMKRNIPYVVRGGLRFFEQAHIKDVLAYLKILINPQDEVSFKRALCLYPGVGRVYAFEFWDKLVKKNKRKEEILKEFPRNVQEGLKRFLRIYSQIKKESSPQKVLSPVIKEYQEYCYLSFDNPQDRLMDLEELAKIARVYPTVKSFLEDLSSYENFKGETLLSSSDKEELLVLSTIHQAKGLEWKVVFIVGFNEYDFPHPKALNSPEALEEERRLFYVAVTRTKQHFFMIYPQTRYTFREGVILSRPSMFISELPGDSYCEENGEV